MCDLSPLRGLSAWLTAGWLCVEQTIAVFGDLAVHHLKARYLELFDQETFYSKQAMDEADQVAFLEEAQEYCHQYRNSVVLFDLDSLALFSQNERDFSAPTGGAARDPFRLQQTQDRIMNKTFAFFSDATNGEHSRRWVRTYPSPFSAIDGLSAVSVWLTDGCRRLLGRYLPLLEGAEQVAPDGGGGAGGR